jgi:hypothetical protein
LKQNLIASFGDNDIDQLIHRRRSLIAMIPALRGRP